MVDTQGGNEKVTKEGGAEREGENTLYARLTPGVPLLCYLWAGVWTLDTEANISQIPLLFS